jgi:hypothetical protein
MYFSIDRNETVVKERIPKKVVQKVIDEILSLVGESDWKDPNNVSASIIELLNDEPKKRTILAYDSITPIWILQSIIYTGSKNRYIEHEGSKYNKVEIIFNNKYFKKQMDKVASHAHCTWNIRWGSSNEPEHKLYQKTRYYDSSWLAKSCNHLGLQSVNIKDLLMIEFKKIL